MPPADNTNTTLPEPSQPKQSFWAKLFGKKPKEPEAPVQQQESQTPPPQLDTPTDGESEAPVAGADVSTSDVTESTSDLSSPEPTAAPTEEPVVPDTNTGVSTDPTVDSGVSSPSPEASGASSSDGSSSSDSSSSSSGSV